MKLSTQSYKGVRDFYPEEWAVQNYIFGIWREITKKFGYVEYNASILEPADLYRGKTSEEIVNEQTYTFRDRADREVTLRPEMTPTAARMIAAKKRELPFPMRWFSIPNLFRYESPQRGRLREHWQLNADIFGVSSIEAEIEIISLATDIMSCFGVRDENFEVRINNRRVMKYILEDWLQLPAENTVAVVKLIDKKEKISKADFDSKLTKLLGGHYQHFLTLLNSKNFEEFSSHLPETHSHHEGIGEIRTLLEKLRTGGIKNVRFDPTLLRGFDYYTGIVFEIFDTNPENRRSLFGGGRYDNLLSIFGSEKVPAVGFGMGDVTIRDVLETYDLIPPLQPPTKLYLCHTDSKYIIHGNALAKKLRTENLAVAVDFTDRKIGDQIKTADRQNIPFVICIGEEEVKSATYKVKNLKTREETSLTEENIHRFVSS